MWHITLTALALPQQHLQVILPRDFVNTDHNGICKTTTVNELELKKMLEENTQQMLKLQGNMIVERYDSW